MKLRTLIGSFFVVGLSAVLCSCKGGPHYSNLDSAQVEQETKYAERNDVDTKEWLELADISHYRLRYPKRWNSPEQVQILKKLLASNHPLIRQLAVSRMSEPKTEADKATAFQVMESMTRDPDNDIKITSLAILYRSHDPNGKSLAEQVIQSPNLSDQDKQLCEKMIKGLPLSTQ